MVTEIPPDKNVMFGVKIVKTIKNLFVSFFFCIISNTVGHHKGFVLQVYEKNRDDTFKQNLALKFLTPFQLFDATQQWWKHHDFF